MRRCRNPVGFGHPSRSRGKNNICQSPRIGLKASKRKEKGEALSTSNLARINISASSSRRPSAPSARITSHSTKHSSRNVDFYFPVPHLSDKDLSSQQLSSTFISSRHIFSWGSSKQTIKESNIPSKDFEITGKDTRVAGKDAHIPSKDTNITGKDAHIPSKDTDIGGPDIPITSSGEVEVESPSSTSPSSASSSTSSPPATSASSSSLSESQTSSSPSSSASFTSDVSINPVPVIITTSGIVTTPLGGTSAVLTTPSTITTEIPLTITSVPEPVALAQATAETASSPASTSIMPPVPPSQPRKIQTPAYDLNLLAEEYGTSSSRKYYRGTFDRKEKFPIKVRFKNSLRRTFLPDGYPKSVSRDYTKFSLWNALQGVAFSASGVLSNQCLLYSVGLGTGALPISVAISWVLKDGLGYIGMIVAGKYGKNFDSDPKNYKWKADLLTNFGLLLEITTIFFPQYFLLIGSVANAVRAVASVVATAIRTSFNNNFKLRENIGDVTAKASSQGVASYIAGLTIGIGLSLLCTENGMPSPAPILCSWAVLTTIHLIASYFALRAVILPALTMERLYHLLEQYLIDPTKIPAPESTSKEKFTKLFQKKASNQISLGSTLSSAFTSPEEFTEVVHLFSGMKYLINRKDKTFHVVLRKECSHDDVFQATFHVLYLHIKRAPPKSRMTWKAASPPSFKEQIKESFPFVVEHWAKFYDLLVEKGWKKNFDYLKATDTRVTILI